MEELLLDFRVLSVLLAGCHGSRCAAELLPDGHWSRGAEEELLPGMGIDRGAGLLRLDIWARLADFLGRMGGGVELAIGLLSGGGGGSGRPCM